MLMPGIVKLLNISCTSRQVCRQGHIAPAALSCTGGRGRSTAAWGCPGTAGTAAVSAPAGSWGWRPRRWNTESQSETGGGRLTCTAAGGQSDSSVWPRGRTAVSARRYKTPPPPASPPACTTGEGSQNTAAPPPSGAHCCILVSSPVSTAAEARCCYEMKKKN